MKRIICCIISVLVIGPLTGCQSLLHELQPHRLWRLNYQDNPGRSDSAFLSISDDLSRPPATDAAAASGSLQHGDSQSRNQ